MSSINSIPKGKENLVEHMSMKLESITEVTEKC